MWPFILPIPPAYYDSVQIKFDSTTYATPSSTLRRQVSDTEAFFTLTPKARSSWDEQLVQAWIVQVGMQINTHALATRITYDPGLQPPFSIFAGKSGITIDKIATTNHIIYSPKPSVTFTAISETVAPPLTPDQITQLKIRLSNLTKNSISFTAQNRTFTLSPTDLTHLIVPSGGYDDTAIKQLISAWAQDFDQPATEPNLSFDGRSIQSFKAPIMGRALNPDTNAPLVRAALTAIEEANSTSSQELIVTTSEPKITLASLNSLGISEIIGRGDSQYHHSIPNRIKNVALTATRIHGHIIMPGEIFSFNQALGDVSAATGFLPAYVISQGKTVLGDGGGVCQVSSTLFRAILNAGLPIVERHGHSYRVSYYELNSQPGFDATVYAPHPDLEFQNDTGTPILINAIADSSNLTMYIELYGKRDGRTAQILNYKQWDIQPAPPPLYQDDPTLPRGTIKQVDFAAGGLKTSFDYKVTYPDGHIKNTTYTTNYIPWQAVFLRGTK